MRLKVTLEWVPDRMDEKRSVAGEMMIHMRKVPRGPKGKQWLIAKAMRPGNGIPQAWLDGKALESTKLSGGPFDLLYRAMKQLFALRNEIESVAATD